MTDHAQRCIAAMDESRLDITMLWLLKQPEWLEQCRAGRELTNWVRKMEVPMHVAKSPEFQGEVLREFKSRGGARPVAPERYVDHWSKDPAKQLCLNANWPKPYFPVMLQLNPRKPGDAELRKLPGRFLIFSCWQDAILALQQISLTKKFKDSDGRWFPVTMIYENQIVDMGGRQGTGYDYPCRLILDCDAKLKEHGEGHTLESLQGLIDQVPAWFVRRLVEIGAIKRTDRVVVFEKEKSRHNKASRHYIFNIMGFSTWDTTTVLFEIFGKEHEKEKKLMEAGQVKKPPALPVWKMVDIVPHHGRAQYSVLGFFDRDKQETEFPCITRRMEIVNGEVKSLRRSQVSRADSSLKHPTALKMLHDTCYSCFAPEFVTMHPKFMVQRSVLHCFVHACRESRTHARTATGNKKGGVPCVDYQGRWTRRGRPPERSRREAGVPAAVGPISDFQDHRPGVLLRCEHEHAVSGQFAQRPKLPCARCSSRGHGPPFPRPFLSQLGVQGDMQGAREQWHVCGIGTGRRSPVCEMRRLDMLLRAEGLGGWVDGGCSWRKSRHPPVDQTHGREDG